MEPIFEFCIKFFLLYKYRIDSCISLRNGLKCSKDIRLLMCMIFFFFGDKIVNRQLK